MVAIIWLHARPPQLFTSSLTYNVLVRYFAASYPQHLILCNERKMPRLPKHYFQVQVRTPLHGAENDVAASGGCDCVNLTTIDLLD